MILILDFGSQYTQLITRRIREQKVYCEIHPFTIDFSLIKSLNPNGIILSGGPSSVFDEDAPSISKQIFNLGVPVLGICYGMQLMVYSMGGQVKPAKHSEYGRISLSLTKNSNLLFKKVQQTTHVWMSHQDHVVEIPSDFIVLGTTNNCPYAAIAAFDKQLYAIQFHPEVYHTEEGFQILQNFIFEICKCQPTWSMTNFIEQKIQELRETIGDQKVLCALSGGVDSSVVAILLHRAIGDQLTCVFVDNGCLRMNEGQNVEKTFREHYNINLIHINASELFMQKLVNVSDPEKKRKIIGNTFIEIFEKEAQKIGNLNYLAQGTLYPDVIESVSLKGPSATIKTHHNVGGLPEKMQLKLIEPLRELFKDEVRLLGTALGMPDKLVYRHPFPGPGLAIRILGEVSLAKIQILQKADAIFLEEIHQAGLYKDIWQCFAVLLPVKSVGVMGDQRTYEWTIALRAVSSVDAMTSDWVNLPYDLLAKVSNRIINEVPKINRVVYDITSKPPGTIEWE